jgi:hypothetical protein
LWLLRLAEGKGRRTVKIFSPRLLHPNIHNGITKEGSVKMSAKGVMTSSAQQKQEWNSQEIVKQEWNSQAPEPKHEE